MNNLALIRSSCILVDIAEYDLETKKYTQFGFALYPLVRLFQGRIYFVSGVQICPIYKPNTVSVKKLSQLLIQNPNVDAMALVRKLVESKEISQAENAFAVIKAVDNQRHGHFLQSLKDLKVDGRFLNAKERVLYTYDQSIKDEKKLADLV